MRVERAKGAEGMRGKARMDGRKWNRADKARDETERDVGGRGRSRERSASGDVRTANSISHPQ